MIGFTDQEERALKQSAAEAVSRLQIAAATMGDTDLGDWEQALWANGFDILVHRNHPIAAIATCPVDDGDGPVVTLIGTDKLNFLADQIHRCQAGALNGFRPAETETLGCPPASSGEPCDLQADHGGEIAGRPSHSGIINGARKWWDDRGQVHDFKAMNEALPAHHPDSGVYGGECYECETSGTNCIAHRLTPNQEAQRG